MSHQILTIEAGELISSDWQRSLKIRKPLAPQPGPGILAFDREREFFVGYDWCGNPVATLDLPAYALGQVYDVRGLGMLATPTLTHLTPEMARDGTWEWVLPFTYPEFTP